MTKTEETYGDSTVAMTVYNVACQTTGNMTKLETMLPIIREHAHSDLSLQRLRRVIRTMKRKGLLVPRGDSLVPCDRKRRIVVQRDRTDARVDEQGRVRGGWNKWFCRDQTIGLVPLKPRPPKAKGKSEVPE